MQNVTVYSMYFTSFVPQHTVLGFLKCMECEACWSFFTLGRLLRRHQTVDNGVPGSHISLKVLFPSIFKALKVLGVGNRVGAWKSSNPHLKSHNCRVQTPGYIHKKPGGFFGWTHLKNSPIKPTKKPPQLKSDFVLCATNKEAFIVLNALSQWILSLYFCNCSKLLVQTLKQATNVQTKDKAPFFSPKSVRK